MEKEFFCPVCKEKMEAGRVYSDRYALRWIPEKEDCGFPVPFKGIKLNGTLDKAYLDAYICQKCKKVIIDYEAC